MTARLSPLGDNRGGAGFDRLINVPQRLHLANQTGTVLSDALAKRPRISEREKHAKRRMAQHLIENMRCAGERPGNEADAKGAAQDMSQFHRKIGLTAKNARVSAAHD